MLGDGSPETVAELNKHLTAFEKELNGKKFVGGGSWNKLHLTTFSSLRRVWLEYISWISNGNPKTSELYCRSPSDNF